MSSSDTHHLNAAASQDNTQYGPEYYKERIGHIPYERNPHWLEFFGTIADEIIRSLRPARVFDAGCGWGFLVEAFWDRGVEARGVDVSEYAISNVRPDMRSYCTVASLANPIADGPFDLVTCIEVVEHIEEEAARNAIKHLTQVTDRILFSSTPLDFEEPTHINVRPVIYWLRLFAAFGYYPDLLFDASFIAPHAFLVHKRSKAVPDEVLSLFATTLQNRIYRVAFLTRHTKISELTEENAALQHKLAASSQDVHGLIASVERLGDERELWKQLSAELRGLTAELRQDRERQAQSADNLSRELRDASDRLEAVRQSESLWKQRAEAMERVQDDNLRRASEFRRQMLRLEAERRESEQQLAATRGQLKDLRLTAERLETIKGEFCAQNREFSETIHTMAGERQTLRSELEAIQSSAGWRAITRYRHWLQDGRERQSWLYRTIEPLFAWGLRKARVLDPQTGTAPGSFTSAVSSRDNRVLLNALSREGMPSPAFADLPSSSGQRYRGWILQSEPTLSQLEIQQRMGVCFSYRPKISILVPVYRIPSEVLRETVDSVFAQTYSNWELCVTVCVADDPDAATYLKNIAQHDSRVKVKTLTANEGISGNSNQALTCATGEFVGLLDHDDTLAPFALFEVALLLNQDREVNFIYSDKDQLSEDGGIRFQPLFKPRWSPDVMLNANYLTHFCVMRTEHLQEIGGWRKETNGAQDWDLFLRVIKRHGKVRHIPKVLYHWRQIQSSVSARGLEAKPYAAQSQVIAVQDHLEASGVQSAFVRQENGVLRVRWLNLKRRISIIYISSQPAAEAAKAASAIADKTNTEDFEILVASTGIVSSDDRVRGIAVSDGSTLAERIDAAVVASTGSVLVFVDESVKPASSDWLIELTGPLQILDIGLVGARLVDSATGVLRHCGIVVTNDGRVENIYSGYPEHVCEEFGSAGWYRNWSAVSGACFSIRREIWDAVGGLSGKRRHPRLDIHLNLKVTADRGLRALYNPYARLLQSGPAALENAEAGISTNRLLSYFPDGDPYFNPNLDCLDGKVTLRVHDEHSARAKGTDYSVESQVLVQIFDCGPEILQRSRNQNLKSRTPGLDSVSWFLPDFTNPFYGGVHTLLRVADSFRRNHNVVAQFCIVADAPEARIRRQIAAAFPELAESSRIFICDNERRIDELPFSDAAVCSLWTTAYAVLRFEQTRRKFYFIQDDESLFYPAGSTSALVEATYQFGFEGICNTPALLERYVARGGQGEYFVPCIDRKVFHEQGRPPLRKQAPYTLFCYGRPQHPRNCFELLGAALQMLKGRMGDDLSVVTAGAEWDVAAYDLDGIVEHFGLLNYSSTGALYRMCDAGVVMMMTRHPSYLPMELMSCGSLVVTNRNPDTGWLLKDDVNCLLAEPTPSCLAERIEEGLINSDLRCRVTAEARKMIDESYSDWSPQIEKIHRFMSSK